MKWLDRRKIEKLLESGKLKELEQLLILRSSADPSYLYHLAWFYYETRIVEKAISTAKRLVLYSDNIRNRYLYYFMLSKLDSKAIEDERVRLRELYHSPALRGYYFLYCGMLDLLEERYNIALKRLKEAKKNGLLHACWGIGRIYYIKGNKDKALSEMQRCLKVAPELPFIWFDLGKMFLEKGRVFSGVRMLSRYVKNVPIDAEARYELGMALLEFSKGFIGSRFIAKAAFKNFRIKALINPQELENAWLYRMLALYAFKNKDFLSAAKWTLIEQKTLYTVLSAINSKIPNIEKVPVQDIMDIVSSMKKVLIEGGVVEEDEFNKALSSIKEMRLLEEMYRLSEERRNKKE